MSSLTVRRSTPFSPTNHDHSVLHQERLRDAAGSQNRARFVDHFQESRILLFTNTKNDVYHAGESKEQEDRNDLGEREQQDDEQKRIESKVFPHSYFTILVQHKIAFELYSALTWTD